MKSIITKYNLTEKRYEDMRNVEQFEDETSGFDFSCFTKEAIYEMLLKGETLIFKSGTETFIYSLSREAIETYLEEQG